MRQTHETQKDQGHTRTQQESAAFLHLPFTYFFFLPPSLPCSSPSVFYAPNITHRPSNMRQRPSTATPNQCKPNDIKPKSDGVKQVHLNHVISGVGMRCNNYSCQRTTNNVTKINKRYIQYTALKSMIKTNIEAFKRWMLSKKHLLQSWIFQVSSVSLGDVNSRSHKPYWRS